MAIKIELKSTIIPVTIGELDFKFDTSDHSFHNLRAQATELLKKVEQLESELKTSKEVPEYEDVMKKVLGEAFDSMLGEGAFEKIYNQTPSSILLINYYVQLINGLEDELKEKMHSEKIDKYIRK